MNEQSSTESATTAVNTQEETHAAIAVVEKLQATLTELVSALKKKKPGTKVSAHDTEKVEEHEALYTLLGAVSDETLEVLRACTTDAWRITTLQQYNSREWITQHI